MRYDNYLFCKNDLRAVLEHQEKRLMEDIENLESNQLLNSSLDDLIHYFIEKHSIEPILLKENEICVDQSEAKIDVSHDFNRLIFDSSKPFYITGTKVNFIVPFEGDRELFTCQPQTYTTNPPRADVNENEIVISFETTEHDSERIKNDFQSQFDSIKSYVGNIKASVDEYNSQLDSKIRAKILSRQEKVKKDQGLAASFGFPLIKREGVPETFVVPQVKRKIIPQLPPTRPPTPPEPTLEMAEYENILKIISDMAIVMERSPKVFIGMEEESLRTHFLVPLNGYYEGQATGETFNFNGKTDILIRVENKNIFIAECKFWKGEEVFTETIDQILGYTSWRDTKTAIIIFNRNKDTSKVLAQIPDILRKHPKFIKEEAYPQETGFRIKMKHLNDEGKELSLTVLVFDVPIT